MPRVNSGMHCATCVCQFVYSIHSFIFVMEIQKVHILQILMVSESRKIEPLIFLAQNVIKNLTKARKESRNIFLFYTIFPCINFVYRWYA